MNRGGATSLCLHCMGRHRRVKNSRAKNPVRGDLPLKEPLKCDLTRFLRGGTGPQFKQRVGWVGAAHRDRRSDYPSRHRCRSHSSGHCSHVTLPPESWHSGAEAAPRAYVNSRPTSESPIPSPIAVMVNVTSASHISFEPSDSGKLKRTASGCRLGEDESLGRQPEEVHRSQSRSTSPTRRRHCGGIATAHSAARVQNWRR